MSYLTHEAAPSQDIALPKGIEVLIDQANVITLNSQKSELFMLVREIENHIVNLHTTRGGREVSFALQDTNLFREGNSSGQRTNLISGIVSRPQWVA